MYKKIIVLFFLIMSALTYESSFALAEENYIDESKILQGIIGVNYPNETGKLMRVMISKNDDSMSYYLLKKNTEYFPLQLGNGEYKIKIYENIKKNSYKLVNEKTVNLNLNTNSQIYLNSVQNINWNTSMKAINKAKELTKNSKSNNEKVTKIYQYIVENISYDYDKVNNLQVTYLPNIENTYQTRKGICYDYASLFAAMLRSVDIPTKLVTGRSTYVEEYHAWNEVYLNNKWVTIDTTVDSSLKKSKKSTTMVKDANKYTRTYQY